MAPLDRCALGDINTPMELAFNKRDRNEIDRFSLAITAM